MDSEYIDVVDGSMRDNGFLRQNRAFHPHAVACVSVASMVANVITRASGCRIKRLRIFGHGSPGHQGVGGGRRLGPAQELTVTLFGHLQNLAELTKLIPHFQGDALVQLHGCSVGKSWRGRSLVRRLADLWHVRVQAALGKQYADIQDAYEGTDYVEADGTIIRSSCLFPNLPPKVQTQEIR